MWELKWICEIWKKLTEFWHEFRWIYPVNSLDKPSKEKNSIWLDPSSGEGFFVWFPIFGSAIWEFPSEDQTLNSYTAASEMLKTGGL